MASAGVSAAAFSVMFAGMAMAQEVPATPASAPTAPTVGRERIAAELLDLDPAGEPTVSPVTDKNAVILSAPLRLRGEGRLAGDIATQSYRMAAGAPVIYREFKQSRTDQSEAVQAWCGPGETRTMFGWSGGGTVCMVHTADGKANLGAPQLSFGSWWTATNVAFVTPDARTDRVAVEPATTPSAFRLVVIYERLEREGVSIRSEIEGPGMTAEAKPYRYRVSRRVLPLNGGSSELVYDGLRVSLTPQRRGDVVAATSERVAPPLDMAALRERVATAERFLTGDAANGPDEAASEPEQGLDATPLVIGGVKLDPAALTPGTGVLSRGDVALSGSAAHALTARLTKPLTLRAPLVNDTSPVGTILHQIEFAGLSPLGTRTMTRIWCGPILKPGLFSGGQRQTLCLRRGGLSGWWEAFIPATGRPWLGTSLLTATPGNFAASELEVEPSATSLLDPLTFRAEIQRINDAAVTLRLFARRGDEDALILTAAPKFENGVATLPLWTHRLTLTRSGQGVVAALSADGDGTAPTDEATYP